MIREAVLSPHTKETQCTGNGLEVSQLTQTGIKSEYESSSLDNLNQ